jgi:hypothetical protein
MRIEMPDIKLNTIDLGVTPNREKRNGVRLSAISFFRKRKKYAASILNAGRIKASSVIANEQQTWQSRHQISPSSNQLINQ